MLPNQSIRRPRIWIVADDLTGACDAGVAFAQRGARTQVLLDADLGEAPEAEVVAISTSTRDLAVEEATRELRSALSLHLSFLSSSSQRTCLSPEDAAGAKPAIFKKIDSVFRGNTFHEIHATIASFPGETAILAPAYPAQGRITQHGTQIATDLTGQQRIDLHNALRKVGISAKHVPASTDVEAIAGQMRSANVLLCDAHLQSHLEAIVAAAGTLDRPILWIGSAGLAHALAAHMFPVPIPPQATQLKGNLLAFIGSNHPVTLRQADALHAAHKVALWAGASWDEPASIPIMTVERNVTSALQIRKATEQLEGPIACLFLTGGDTAAQVCRALGIRSLCLQQEFAPGVPQGTAMGGRLHGSTLILKSGGFGEAHLLTDIAQHFQPSEARL